MLSRENAPVSPRRRALLACCLAALGILAVVGELRLRAAHPVATTRPVAQDRPGPVLLVPGYGGSTAGLEVLAGKLRAAGRPARVVALPGDGTGDLRAAAGALDLAARTALASGASSVDVVGYSAGGVTARFWARQLGGAAVARRIVTLGAPHHGTRVAALGSVFAPGACPPACEQLVPGSQLLRDLNRGDETPEGPQWLALWTDRDAVVTPPRSAGLAGAVDVVLQAVCPGVTVSHADLPRSPLVAGIVLRALGPGPLPRPRTTDCASLTAAGG